MNSLEDVKNGQWWETPWPRCHRATSQWVDADQWILLGEEAEACGGGTCRVAFSDDAGKVIITQKELLDRLNNNGWKKSVNSSPR